MAGQTGGTAAEKKKLWLVKSDLMYQKKILPAGDKNDLADLPKGEIDRLRREKIIEIAN